MLSSLLTLLIPVVVAVAAGYLAEVFQKISAPIDALPASLKRIAVTAIAGLLTVAATKLRVTLTGDVSTGGLGALTIEDISAMLSASLAFIFHLGDQAKKNAP